MHQFACPIIHIFKIHTIATGAGNGAKCGAKFAATSCITIGKATSASQMRKELEHCSL
jgi:hypothetical protein